MAGSQPVLRDMEGDAVFFQEHTLGAEKASLAKALAAEKGWRMDIGPVNQGTDKVTAGVGAMWNEKVLKVQLVKLVTAGARDLEAIGRLRKYVIQHAHGYPFTVYNIYGWTNGATDHDANGKTNELLEEVHAGARLISDQPYIIVGGT